MTTARMATLPAAIRVVAAVIAGILTLVVTRHGVVVSPDSVIYLSTGENVAAGDGLTTYLGEGLVDFPPGVPLLYAVGSLLPGSLLAFVRVSNAVLLMATVWWVSRVIERDVASRWITTIATIVLGLGVGMLAVTRAAWSEPWFILAALGLTIRASELACASAWSRRYAAEVVALSWLMFFLRYIGIVLIGVGVAAILLRGSVDGWRASLRRAAMFATVTAGVPAVWLMRNHLVNGSFVGMRPPSTDTLGAALHRFATVVSQWVVPDEVVGVSSRLRVLLGLLIVVALLVGSCWVLWSGRPRRALDERSALLVISWCALVALALALVASQLRTAIDPLDARLMSPLLAIGVVVAALVADSLASATPQRVRLAMGALAVPLVMVQAVSGPMFAIDGGNEGYAFTRPSWKVSEVVAAAGALPSDVVVVTNSPAAVWAITGRDGLVESPTSGAYRSSMTSPLPADYAASAPCGEVAFVWIDRAAAFHHRPEFIGEVISLDREQVFDDGTIWRMQEGTSC